ncbi:MAG TPA: IS1595 family transposase [Gammaproteobacteria bacterium]|nr:IS1595 family transposase [Gammaproteobacteria bacterium]
MNKSKVQNRSTKNDPVIQEIPLACADEKAAVEFLEKQRWGDHPGCPHCGDTDVYQMKDSKTGERQANFRWRCNGCKSQFTVRKGTVFEDSRIPLRHWCYGFWRASTSKKGVSALEIHRHTGVSYKSSLFMLHRIRFAMSDSAPAPLSGDVEVDETYVGGKPRYKGQSKTGRGTRKQCVVALVERGGSVKTKPVANVTGKTLKQIIRDNVDASSRIITDENRSYSGIGSEFDGGHETVCHSAKEYVRGDIHSNTVEGFFSTVKRGLNGIYHSVSKEHSHRYMSEFEFRSTTGI